MSIKDKIIFGLLGVLVVAGVYFQLMADDMKSRMSELNVKDTEHLDVIDKEFCQLLYEIALNAYSKFSVHPNPKEALEYMFIRIIDSDEETTNRLTLEEILSFG